MLVRDPLIPAASIAMERSHLNGIAIHKHRRRHIIPWAHQTHHFFFKRRENQLDIPGRRRVNPRFINALRKERRNRGTDRIGLPACSGPKLLTLITARMKIDTCTSIIPIVRFNLCHVKIIMPPIPIFTGTIHCNRITGDITLYRNVQSAIPISTVRTPRMVHMQRTCRIKTFTQRADIEINCTAHCTVNKYRVGHRKIIGQLYHTLGRYRHVGRI